MDSLREFSTMKKTRASFHVGKSKEQQIRKWENLALTSVFWLSCTTEGRASGMTLGLYSMIVWLRPPETTERNKLLTLRDHTILI